MCGDEEKMKMPEGKHKCLQPIYNYCREINKTDPIRAKQIANICLELCFILGDAPIENHQQKEINNEF
jgi:hypothetical protein